MEEGSEFVRRLTQGGTLPMMTSCSPGWIKFVEQFYPEFIDNLSTCKSPQQMMGAVIKSFFAEQQAAGDRSQQDLQRVHHAVHGQEIRGRTPGDGERRRR